MPKIDGEFLCIGYANNAVFPCIGFLWNIKERNGGNIHVSILLQITPNLYNSASVNCNEISVNWNETSVKLPICNFR